MVPQPLPHLDFGFGVAAADVRHAAMALCGGHGVGHGGSVLVEDDQGGDDAGHPAGAGEDENDKYRPAPPVKHRQRREDNGEDDAEEGHDGYFLRVSYLWQITSKLNTKTYRIDY